jgi:hypothetical protein
MSSSFLFLASFTTPTFDGIQPAKASEVVRRPSRIIVVDSTR